MAELDSGGIIALVPSPRAALCAFALVVSVSAPLAQRTLDDAVITGDVLAPDGQPVTGGSVALMTTAINKNIATIDRNGHFRIASDSQGERRLFIAVPRLAPYRAIVSVPPSRRMHLPPITLSAPTYYVARFVTVDGDPIASGLRRQSIDTDGMPIEDPLDHTREQVEPDGTTTIGPLPRGRTLLGFDRAPLAPTRLPDITVSDAQRLIDRGTITIQPPTQLQIDIVDGSGQAVPQHDVWIEDAVQPSPLSYRPVKTDARGRAVFERLGRGRYRLWTKAIKPCGVADLSISRLVSAGAANSPPIRMVIGGRASLRITTPLGALLARAVSVWPDSPPESPWRFVPSGMRRSGIELTPPSCGGVTDADGRVTFASFPPGPANVRVSLFNSSYFTRVTVPEKDTEITIAIPDGLIPVRVIDRATQRPIANAHATWVGGGGRVEATATANGDALLEATGAAGGTLTISDRDHQPLEGAFDITPDTLQEVALSRLPQSRFQVQVSASDNKPVADAVVELIGGADVTHFASTDAKGIAFFNEIGRGALRVIVHADGFSVSSVQVAEDARASIRIVMKTR